MGKVAAKCILLVCLYAAAMAQQAGMNLEKRLYLPAVAMRLDSLLGRITVQTGMKFSLNTRKYAPSKTIRLKGGAATVAGLLKEISAHTGTRYVVRGAYIIFTDPPPQRQTVTVKAPLTPVRKPPLRTAIAREIKEESRPQHIVLNAVTTAIPWNITIIPPLRQAAPAPLQYAGNIPHRRQKRQGKVWPLLAPAITAGIAADDIFYTAPTIAAGPDLLHGMVSWNTNFKVSGIRYGIGSTIRLSNDWALHITITTGELSRHYDTTGRQRTVKQQLHGAGILLDRQLGKGFHVQLGPVLNLLSSKYYMNGEPFPLEVDADWANRKYHLVKPLYTFRNTYAASAVHSTQQWIGIQLRICYTIRFFKRE